jgi:hypothetical protein
MEINRIDSSSPFSAFPFSYPKEVAACNILNGPIRSVTVQSRHVREPGAWPCSILNGSIRSVTQIVVSVIDLRKRREKPPFEPCSVPLSHAETTVNGSVKKRRFGLHLLFLI